MRKKQFIYLWSMIVFTIFLVIFFTGCLSRQIVPKSKLEETAPREDLPKVDNEVPKELVIALNSGNLNFDPAHAYTTLEAQVFTAVFEGLVSYNPLTLSPLPGVARNWTISDDGTIYQFYLRENAIYSNGEKIKAQDFRDSWLRILNPDLKAEFSTFFDIIKGAAAYRSGVNKDISQVGIRVSSDNVLEVELEKPAAHFLNLLCHMSFVPLYKEYRTDVHGTWAKASTFIGNGAYFVSRHNVSEIILSKNNFYWDAADVALERIVIRFYDEPIRISEGYNQGSIHWAMDWDFEKIEDKSSVIVAPMFATSFLFFKSVVPPWNDPRVRRALALLIPWEEIRNKEYLSFPTEKLIPYPDYPEVQTINQPNLEEAFRLLEEAGFPEGKELPEIIIRTQGVRGNFWAEKMAKAWKEKLGAVVTIEEIEPLSYFKSLKQNDYAIGQMTWIGDFLDPLTFLQLWTSQSNLNDAGYNNEQYDQLIQEGIPEKEKKRLEKFSQAESLLLSQAVIFPLSNQPSLNLINVKHIEGWYPNLLDIHPFKYLRFKEPRAFPNLVRSNSLRGLDMSGKF